MEYFTDFFVDHFIISLVWVFLFVSVVYVTFICWCANFSEISSHEAVRLINQKNSVVVDIRDQNHFYFGHILNSVHLSDSDIRTSAACELRKFDTRPMIIVCSDGVLSCSIARYLHKLGFKQLYVLKGGINSWNEELLPLVKKSK